MSADDHIQEIHDVACCHAGLQVRVEAHMATKPTLEQNWRSRFAEAMRLNPPLVSGDHHAQQFHDGVATMSAFKFG